MSRWMSRGLVLAGVLSLSIGIIRVALGQASENTLMLLVFGIVSFLLAAALSEAGEQAH